MYYINIVYINRENIILPAKSFLKVLYGRYFIKLSIRLSATSKGANIKNIATDLFWRGYSRQLLVHMVWVNSK